MEVTLTIRRPDQDITVVLRRVGQKWKISEALDEFGRTVRLNSEERSEVVQRAELGQDETGY